MIKYDGCAMKSENFKAGKTARTKSPKCNQYEETGGNSPLDRLLETLKPIDFQDPHRGGVHVQPVAVLRAYQMARLAEIVSPASSRSRHGTVYQYESALNTLRALDPLHGQRTYSPNPFLGFMKFDFGNRSTPTFYKYKAALQAHAVHLLLQYGEAAIIQFWDDAFVQEASDDQTALAAETDRRVRMLHCAFNAERTLDTLLEQSFKKDIQNKAVLLRQKPSLFAEVISATAYLAAFPPLLQERTEHIIRRTGSKKSNLRDLQIESQGLTVFDIAEGFKPVGEWSAQSSQKLHASSSGHGKRQVVAKLNRLDKRYGDKLDWRERFFHFLDGTPKRGREDKKKQAAILTLTGCRPSELSRGVRIYLEKIDGFEGLGRPAFSLTFRILGSKCTTLPHDQEIAIFDKMNAAECKFKKAMYDHPAHLDSQERGHEWRIIRVSSDTPEAAFLADYIREVGDPADTDISRDPSLLDAEMVAINELTSGRLTHQITAFPQSLEQALDQISDEDELPEEIVNAQARNLGAWISYHSRKLYPRLEPAVTPYAWRHQFASDLKSYADDPEIFAKALGQRSQKTQAHYGHSSSSASSKFSHIDIRTSHAVRSNYQPYPEARARISQVRAIARF